MDAFDDEAEAESWAKTYFDYLRTLKIKVIEIKKPRLQSHTSLKCQSVALRAHL
jgi:hypothetical protein